MDKLSKKQIERLIYILVIVCLVVVGVLDSETATTLIKAFSEAMQIIISTTPEP